MPAACGYGVVLAGGPRRRGDDLDDWFAESEPARTNARDRTTRDVAPPAEPLAPSEDWLSGDDASGPRRSTRALIDVLQEWRVVVATGVLAVLLLLGLWVGGVFSTSHVPVPRANGVTTHPKAAAQAAPQKKKKTPVVPSPVAGPTSTLKPGDSGQEVTSLQKSLQGLGYLTASADGVYGPATQTAVARFQTASNLTSDGVFGPATLAALAKALAGP